MYIGPWQEYKLAQVIKVKNDLYEGNSDHASFKHPRTHDSLNLSNHSHVSTPSTRTFSSEPIQRGYPKFAIDRYYEQWRKVEHLMSMPNEVHKKPPLPKLQVRQRQGKSIQEKRVNRMRVLYGFNKPAETQSNLEDSPKISFVDKLKNKVKESEKIPFDKKEFKEDEKKILSLLESPGKSGVNQGYSEKAPEFDGIQHQAAPVLPGVERNRPEIPVVKVQSLEKRFVYEEEKKENYKVRVNQESEKFTSLACINELDPLEESMNHEGVDGLLQWVEELPDEVSSTMKDYRDIRSREQAIIM